MAEIIKLDNFLPENYYQGIFNTINNRDPFPWFLYKDVVAPSPINPKQHGYTKEDKDFCFIHMFYQDGIYHSQLYTDIVLPVWNKICEYEKHDCTIMRAKLNGYVNHYKQVEHDWHIDVNTEIPYKSALYYINTNNGRTEFDDGARGHIKIPSVSNTLVIAPGEMRHRSVTQTDITMRQTLNIVYRVAM